MITKRYVSSHFFNYACAVTGSQGDQYLVVYDVSRFDPKSGKTDYRDWSCTCPHYLNRCLLSGDYCKHIKSVMALTPEEGGMSLWIEDDMSVPVFKVSHEARMHMAQWVDYIRTFGNVALCENAAEAAEAIAAIDNAIVAHVPGIMFKGEMIVAVQADDYRGTSIPRPRIAPDLDYGAKKAALVAQFAAEAQAQATNAPAKPGKPMMPPAPQPQIPLKPSGYRPGTPTPKPLGGK